MWILKLIKRGFHSDSDILFIGHSCQSMADPERASMNSACAGVTLIPDMLASSLCLSLPLPNGNEIKANSHPRHSGGSCVIACAVCVCYIRKEGSLEYYIWILFGAAFLGCLRLRDLVFWTHREKVSGIHGATVNSSHRGAVAGLVLETLHPGLDSCSHQCWSLRPPKFYLV